MPEIEFQNLSTEELTALHKSVTDECDRRNRIANAPAQATALADLYAADGGNVADLVAVLEAHTAEPVAD